MNFYISCKSLKKLDIHDRSFTKTEKSVSDSFDFDTKPHQLDDEIPQKATQQELPWDETPSTPVSKTTQQVADAFEDLFK